jgi:hypothetical protein
VQLLERTFSLQKCCAAGGDNGCLNSNFVTAERLDSTASIRFLRQYIEVMQSMDDKQHLNFVRRRFIECVQNLEAVQQNSVCKLQMCYQFQKPDGQYLSVCKKAFALIMCTTVFELEKISQELKNVLSTGEFEKWMSTSYDPQRTRKFNDNTSVKATYAAIEDIFSRNLNMTGNYN